MTDTLNDFMVTADIKIPGLNDEVFDNIEDAFNKNEDAIEPGLGAILLLESLLSLFIVKAVDIYEASAYSLDIVDESLEEAGVEEYKILRYGVAAPVGDELAELFALDDVNDDPTAVNELYMEMDAAENNIIGELESEDGGF